MTRPRIATIFTGGTISMLVDPAAGGAVPALDGAAILARTPGLDRIAEVVPVDLARTPASAFTFAGLLEIAAAIRDRCADPTIDGVVVVQGTDTIEETAFLFDLLQRSAKPVVVTGAMRNAGEAGWDGPANLRAAARVAASAEAAGRGVMVVLAGTIEPADDVTKTHASALDTFRSLNAGRLGRVEDGRVIFERKPGPRRGPLALERAAEPIPIVIATVAMDPSILDAVTALGPAGIVVEATGAGNTAPGLLDAATRAMTAGIPVVLTTRCPGGAAGTAYGFPGGGASWVRAGAMLAGTLTGPKARIALALGLGAGLARGGLSTLLAGPGARGPAVRVDPADAAGAAAGGGSR